MAICNIEAVNGFGRPIKDVDTAANPNIVWWNGGSQIYCWQLVNAAQFLLTGKYEIKDGDGIFAQPFRGKSDEKRIARVACQRAGLDHKLITSGSEAN